MARLLPYDRPGGPLRLLWLIDSLTLGGAERLAVAFARAVEPVEVGLTVCALKRLGDNPYEAELRATGAAVVHLGSRGLRDLSAFRRLLRLARGARVELVHAHLTDAAIWGAGLARLTGCPLVATLHVEPGAAPRWTAPWLRERVMAAALRRWAARVIAVSAAQRDGWLAAGMAGRPPVVVPNGVDLAVHPTGEREVTRRELGIAPGDRVAIAVAALRGDEKGIDVLLRAMRRIAAGPVPARLLVVGSGAKESTFREMARALGVADHARFLGFRRDIPRLLGAADVFVLPSRRDALPTVLMEAMAAGLPVVASAVGGIPELVDAPATGRLVPPGDETALADALLELLERPSVAAALGGAGRRRAEERFGVDRWLASLGKVYASALEES